MRLKEVLERFEKDSPISVLGLRFQQPTTVHSLSLRWKTNSLRCQRNVCRGWTTSANIAIS